MIKKNIFNSQRQVCYYTVTYISLSSLISSKIRTPSCVWCHLRTGNRVWLKLGSLHKNTPQHPSSLIGTNYKRDSYTSEILNHNFVKWFACNWGQIIVWIKMRHCLFRSFRWGTFTRWLFKTLLTKQVPTEAMTKPISISLELERLRKWEQWQSNNKTRNYNEGTVHWKVMCTLWHITHWNLSRFWLASWHAGQQRTNISCL